MTEEQFWNSTPKKISALLKVYKKSNGVEEEEEKKVVYIDDIL